MLKVKDLSFRYPNGPRLLEDINFSLEKGKVLAVLGNNGAGKSTMLKCLNKIINPKKGSIKMNNEELTDMKINQIAKRIAFVAQSLPEAQMLVYDMVMLGRRPYMGWGLTQKDYKIVYEAMETLDLISMKNRFLNQLSGGERQKVMLARALAQQARLLLLDEPTSNLDIQNQYQVLQTVQNICYETGIMSIVVIHDLNLALRFCDEFLLMKDGKVYGYGGSEILSRKAIWDIYNIKGEIVSVNNKKTIIID